MFNQFKKEHLAGDIWGGLAATLVALPFAVAFGTAIYSPFGPSYVAQGATAGILGAIFVGFVAPIFGGTPQLISAPGAVTAATMTTLVADFVAQVPSNQIAESAPRILMLITLVGFLAAALQFMYGLIGGGRIIKYIPFPVVSGYLSAVGVYVVLNQLPKFFGLPKNQLHLLFSPSNWQWPAIIVGSITIFGAMIAPRITKKVPAMVIGLTLGIISYFGLGLVLPELMQLQGNRLIIGPVSGGVTIAWQSLVDRWQALNGITWVDISGLLVPAITLSLLLSIDTLKTCVMTDTVTRTRHNSNQELIGQGIANFLSVSTGGVPGGGTLGPTMVNIHSGGRTPLSGILVGVFTMVIFILLNPFIGWMPISALAGILILVSIRIIDWHSFHLLRDRTTVFDFCVSALVVIVSIKYNLVAAAGVGLGFAILLFLREQIRSSVIRHKFYGDQIFSKQHRLPAEKETLCQHGPLTTVCELQGSLFFGTTDQLFSELQEDLTRSRYLILDMRRVHSVDYTAAHLLELFDGILKNHGGLLLFSNLPSNLPSGQVLRTYLDKMGLIQSSQNSNLFGTLDEALEWVENQILKQFHAQPKSPEKCLELADFDFFQSIKDSKELTALQSIAKSKSYASGQTIFKKDETGDELLLIRRGIVRITFLLEEGKSYHLASFAQGNFLGDLSFLDRRVRSADAIASEDTDVFAISRHSFDQITLQYPMLAARLFAYLAHGIALRLRYTDVELRAWQEN